MNLISFVAFVFSSKGFDFEVFCLLLTNGIFISLFNFFAFSFSFNFGNVFDKLETLSISNVGLFKIFGIIVGLLSNVLLNLFFLIGEISFPKLLLIINFFY